MKQLAFLGSLVLCGCAVGPDFHTPAAPDAQTYTQNAEPSHTVSAGGKDGATQTFTTADTAMPTWWRQFHSPDLDRLVEQALSQSPTLAKARARLIEARENYNAQAGATQFPSIDAKLSGARQQVDLAAFGIPSVVNPGPFSLFNASVSVSYIFDVFGGNRRALEATLAQVDYQAFQLDAARLSVAGNVVSTVVQRASLQQQILLTQRVIEAQEQQLTIVEARLTAGGVSQLDVNSQRALLAQTRASLPPLATQLAQADHQLAILIGDAPSKADFDPLTLQSLHLPDDIPVTLPSALARQRPDVRASEALLHQASANVGVATANLYPQFSLSAGIGSERTSIQNIVSGLNVWNVGLNLAQPIFHGGELHAKKRAAQAAYDAAFASYRQTVLQALQQVADALTALSNDAHELRARDGAARQANANLDIARAQFSAGGVSQLSLLDTQRQALQTALDRTRAQANRLSDTAALFQSLGGDLSDTTLGSAP